MFSPVDSTSVRIVCAIAIALTLVCSLQAGTPVESFTYPSDQAAVQAWRAIDGSPAVVRNTGGGLVFTCPFDQARDRVYWDRMVTVDLSQATRLELDLSCDQPAALRSLAIYLKSGDGWYIWNKPLPAAGRQRLSLPKSEFSVEGKPAGWNRIERIRFSPWKGSPLATRVMTYSLTAHRDDLYVLKATGSARDATERAFSARVAERVSGWLSHAGIPHVLTTEDDFLRTGAASARLVVLPYNPQPTAALLGALKKVTERQGALVVCFSDSPQLADLMLVDLGGYVQSKETGRWAGMVFTDAGAWRLPEKVYQQSWNIRIARPKPEQGRVIAYWMNALGQHQEEPAWIATSRGLWMTHVLLDDDRAGKERLLIGLLGHYDPGVWASAAHLAAANAGRVDDFPTFTASVDGIRRMAREGERAEAVEGRLAAALATHQAMREHLAKGRHADVVDAAALVRRQLTEAYSMAQPARPQEMRGVWDHDAVGWYPGDWDRTCRELKEAGINTLFVNLLWAGLAHYPSKVVPSSDTNRRLGDQTKACLTAARKYGLKVHAWKVCWQVENAPAEWKEKLRKEGRLQQNAEGRPVSWLNPALPANRQLELNALEELARTYALDGIHLDYIRYPDSRACYAPASRRAFEAWRGAPVAAWPGAVRSGAGLADYQRWRASVITDFVREASQRIKAARPGIQVSAAVWGGYPDTIPSIGQDWAVWLKEGYVDFVCPMNYTEDAFRFSALVQKQMALPGARGRVFPGIGITASESQLRPDEVVEQIATLRRLNATGFVLYDLSQTLRQDVLPVLRQGVTR
jgi:uncharacterized lipoprotein YddW (UPF0748 family)